MVTLKTMMIAIVTGENNGWLLMTCKSQDGMKRRMIDLHYDFLGGI